MRAMILLVSLGLAGCSEPMMKKGECRLLLNHERVKATRQCLRQTCPDASKLDDFRRRVRIYLSQPIFERGL